MKKILKALLEIITIVIISLCIMGIFFSDRFIFKPNTSSYSDSADIIKLTLPDKSIISALYFPPKTKSNSYVVLVSHGNTEDIGTTMPLISYLVNKGYAVMAYDYPGYGTSSGISKEKNSYASAAAAFKYLVHNKKIKQIKIISYGHSLGSAMAIDLASKYDLGGVFIEGAFLSTFRVLTGYTILPFDKFNNIEKIARIHEPKVIVHGSEDKVIPVWHSQELFANAPNPKYLLIIPQAGHSNCAMIAPKEYSLAWDKLLELMSAHQYQSKS